MMLAPILAAAVVPKGIGTCDRIKVAFIPSFIAENRRESGNLALLCFELAQFHRDVFMITFSEV